LIFASKAHPRDDAGKELIRQIADLTRRPELGRYLIFLVAVGTKIQVRTRVQLDSLLPQDVAVELYLGRLNPAGDFIHAVLTPMEPVEKDNRGNFSFEAVTTCPESGMHGFTDRIRPHNPDLSVPFLPGLICWADGGRTGTPA
jgi:hypothetical protein